MNRGTCGFLLGLGAGAALGILLAPRSGAKTRSLLQKKANDGADYLRQQGKDARKAASGIVRDGSRKIAKGTEAVKDAVDAGQRVYRDFVART